MDLIEEAKTKIKGRNLKLVMPEGADARIVAAAKEIESQQLATVSLYKGDCPLASGQHVNVVQALRPKLTEAMTVRLLAKPLYRAGVSVATGEAHAMLAGVEHATAKVIEAALMTIGLAEGITTPSSYFLMQWPDRDLLFADCALNVAPTSKQLAEIVMTTVKNARSILPDEPRVALLSFSTKGSAKHESIDRIINAMEIVRSNMPDVLIDGEFQLDAALSPEIAARKVAPGSPTAGRANILIFPDLNAGNIAYKTAVHLGGAKATGPILQGFAKPVSDLSRSATVDDIVSTAALLLASI
jgi:phosphate acetyltransferase